MLGVLPKTMKMFLTITGLLVLASVHLVASEQEQVVPPEKFQGLWENTVSSMTALEAGQDHGEWKKKGEKEQIHFRKHQSGAIQRVWKNEKGEVIMSRGLTILSQTDSQLKYREWSDHPGCYTEMILESDSTMTMIARTPKHMMKAALVLVVEKKAEQAGTGQPATRPEPKSEGSAKPQPEAEGRSR